MVNWSEHKAHRAQVIQDEGMWVGLADENCEPMFDLPSPVKLRAPETRLQPVSLELTLPVRTAHGGVHPVVDEVVAQGWGRIGDDGRLVPDTGPSRWVVVEPAVGLRRAYKVTGASLQIWDSPELLEIKGTDCLSRLKFFVGASWPETWQNAWTRFTRDWAGPENAQVTFTKPRDLADIKLATAADGWVLEGPAEQIIRRFISDSLASCFRVAGIREADQYIRVDPTESGVPSAYCMLRPQDNNLWDEIADVCMAWGVQVTARLWWPGDAPVGSMNLSKPTIVVRVEQKAVAL